MTFWLGFLCGAGSVLAGIALFVLALLFSKDTGPRRPR